MKNRTIYVIIILLMFIASINSLEAQERMKISFDDLLLDSKTETPSPNKKIEVRYTTDLGLTSDKTTENKVFTTTEAASDTAKIKFKTADDKTEALVIKEHTDHQTIEVNLDGQTFIMKARENKPGVRKYKEFVGNEDKVLIAEVKTKDDSFKLVDENDKLLWKVKIKGEKVKISDNEDNKNPYVLKKSDDKVKVKDKNEKEIARVKYYPENGKLKLKDNSGNELYISKDCTKLSGAIGVLAIKEIPAKLRAVIAAELVKLNY